MSGMGLMDFCGQDVMFVWKCVLLYHSHGILGYQNIPVMQMYHLLYVVMVGCFPFYNLTTIAFLAIKILVIYMLKPHTVLKKSLIPQPAYIIFSVKPQTGQNNHGNPQPVECS